MKKTNTWMKVFGTILLLSFVSSTWSAVLSSVTLVPTSPTTNVVDGDTVSFDVFIDFVAEGGTLGGGFDVVFDPSALGFVGLTSAGLGDATFGRDPDILTGSLESWGVADFNGLAISGPELVGSVEFVVLPTMGASTSVSVTPTSGIAGPWVSFLDFVTILNPDYNLVDVVRPVFTPEVCGDSSPGLGEECDDGNLTNGDGCSATCTFEPGFDCSAAIAGVTIENILEDGSFEDGNSGGEWTSINHSILGPDQICDDNCFVQPFAANPDGSLTSGNYVLVAGGAFDPNSTGNVTHGAVSIPANAITLEFQWATLNSGPAGDACTGANDGLELALDGNLVWSNLDSGPCTNVSPYERVLIDLSTAPGGPYQGTTVGFEFTGSATGLPPDIDLTSVMLDDVSIMVPVIPPIPPTPSMCIAIVCGDAMLGSTESCDDGNAVGGDGCSASCLVEQPNFICEDPIPSSASGENVPDGSLETGSPNLVWEETGTEFTPICSQAYCGAALANDGAFYAWFGGANVPNNQTLTQTFGISSTATALTFELQVGVCDSVNDSLTVEIDGTEIYRYDCSTDTSEYQTQTVPLGAFADGAMHTLQFIGSTVATNAGNSNFFVDDISIADNIAFPGAPSLCFELNSACTIPEQFESGIPGSWTVINLGADPSDGWGASNDGVCATANWSPDQPGDNATGGGGLAACADSDATGQNDINVGGAGAELEMDTYLCSPVMDLSQVVDPGFSFLVNYQTVNNELNDDDFLEVLVGTVPPNALSIGTYTVIGEIYDHLDSTLALSEAQALSANLDAQNAETSAHVCFHYRGTYSWYAQIDNAALRGSDCSGSPALDTDSDGVLDNFDNCTTVANPDQLDTNGDGHGNACDADLNNDCIINFIDYGQMKPVFFTADPDSDFNGDGAVNFIDLGTMKSQFFAPPGPSAAGLCTP